MKKIVMLLVALVGAGVAAAQTSFGVKAGVGFANTDLSVKEVTLGLSPGTKTGFYAGPFVDFGLGDKFALRVELTYNLEGFRVNFSDFPAGDIIAPLLQELADIMPDPEDIPDLSMLDNIKLNGAMYAHYHNLKLPVMARFRPAGGLSIMAGPYVSYRVAVGTGFNGDLKTLVQLAESADGSSYADDLKTSVKDNFSAFDMGLAFGVEYSFDMGVFFEARYTLGLLNTVRTDPFEDSSYSLKARSKHSAVQIGMGVRF